MNVTSLTSAADAPMRSGALSTTGKTELGYDTFLQLLLTQMKNQDPTEPMASTDYMAQLASFSQVEQSVAANSKLDALLTSASLSTAGAVVGRTVTSGDGTVSGVVSAVHVTAEGPVAELVDGQRLLLQSGVVVS